MLDLSLSGFVLDAPRAGLKRAVQSIQKSVREFSWPRRVYVNLAGPEEGLAGAVGLAGGAVANWC